MGYLAWSKGTLPASRETPNAGDTKHKQGGSYLHVLKIHLSIEKGTSTGTNSSRVLLKLGMMVYACNPSMLLLLKGRGAEFHARLSKRHYLKKNKQKSARCYEKSEMRKNLLVTLEWA